MRRLRAGILRLWACFGKQRKEREFAAEIESHLQLHIEDNLRSGMALEEARRRALMKLGGVEQTKEAYRDRRGLPSFETLVQDIGYGARTLRKSPGFAAIAALTLGLGIAANTAIFTTVSGILLRKPPGKDPDRVVVITAPNRTEGSVNDPEQPVSAPDFLDWRDQSHSFEEMGAMHIWRDFTVTGNGEPQHIAGMQVSANFFRLLGVGAELGRTFVAGEDVAGHEHVVVVSHGLWDSRFGSDPNIVGRVIKIDGQDSTVIGVMPARFNFWMFSPQAWTPLVFRPKQLDAAGRQLRWIYPVARLRPHISLQQAQAEMRTIAARLEQSIPADKGWGAAVFSLQEFQIRDANVRPALAILMAAVGLVLLIACANVAGLLLTRGAARKQEIAVRAALGASRMRLVRQLFTENLLLTALGTGLGLLLAVVGVKILRASLHFNEVMSAVELRWDLRVVMFTLATSALSLLLFGLFPVLHSAEPNLQAGLNESARTVTSGRPRLRTRRMLVTFEIALSLVLLAGAGLLIRQIVEETRRNHGFNPQNLLTADISLTSTKYSNAAEQARFFSQVVEHAQGLPGVERAALTNGLPAAAMAAMERFQIDGRPDVSKIEHPKAARYVVSPGYIETMQIALLEGRSFTNSDNAATLPVLLVNAQFEHQFFPGANVLGQHIRLDSDSAPAAWREIIGVVANVEDWIPQPEPHPQIYEPFLQTPVDSMTLVLRTATDASALAPAVRHAVWSVDEDQPVGQMMTMEQVMNARGEAGDRLMGELLATFAACALLLATVGLYGVVAYAVSQRTHEIAIRVALGAERGDIITMILSEGIRFSAVGLTLGCLAAMALPSLFSGMLQGFHVNAVPILLIVPALIGVLAVTACYIPAHRASRLDPMSALRSE